MPALTSVYFLPSGLAFSRFSTQMQRLPERPPRGYSSVDPPWLDVPVVKYATAFFDGQNIYHNAKDAFGHDHPNYDPKRLFGAICARMSWMSSGVRFYTGTPDYRHDPVWHAYWANRLRSMKRAGIHVESRLLHYRKHDVRLPDGSVQFKYVPQEKEIDLRLGLDVVRLARRGKLDVAVIFSQDQDFAEVVREIKKIALETDRWIKVVSAYPSGSNATSKCGIDGADWYQIDRKLYDSCLDSRDYRPRRAHR